MMDPVTALGVAGTAVQFFDFSLKILKRCREICKSASGTTKEYEELEKAIKEARTYHEQLSKGQAQRVGRRVQDCAKDCIETSDELLEILKSIRRIQGTKTLRAVKVAFKSLLDKKTIEKLEHKLRNQEQKLDSAYLDKISRQIDENTVEQDLKLKSLSEGQSNIIRKVLQAECDIKSAILQSETTIAKVIRDTAAGSEANIIQHIERVHQKIDLQGVRQKQEQTEGLIEKALLDSLFFNDICSRRDSIKDPYISTFEWIFGSKIPKQRQRITPDDWDFGPFEMTSASQHALSVNSTDHATPSSHKKNTPSSSSSARALTFIRWLEEQNGVYWINGSAGSGKSTLMAFITRHTTTKELLTQWSQHRQDQLIIGSFFFWQPGSYLQRSVEGLLKSMLFQILQQRRDMCKNLITLLDIDHKRLPDWSVSRLTQAFTALLRHHEDTYFCFFIDGLDEFSGDYDEVLDWILTLRNEHNVKFCISSRPEVQIAHRLHAFPTLNLAEANFEDIHTFICDKLRETSLTNSLDAHELALRAEGVFLWAALLLDSVKKGQMSGESVETSKRRVERTPGKLHDLYSDILNRVDEFQIEDGAFFLGAMCNSDDKDLDLTLVAATQMHESMTYPNFLQHCFRTARYITASTGGLIKCTLGTYDWDDCYKDWEEWYNGASLKEQLVGELELPNIVCARAFIDGTYHIQNGSLNGIHKLARTRVSHEQMSYDAKIFEFMYNVKLSWLHRSARDCFLNSTISQAKQQPPRREILSSLVKASMRLMLTAPLRTVHIDLTVLLRKYGVQTTTAAELKFKIGDCIRRIQELATEDLDSAQMALAHLEEATFVWTFDIHYPLDPTKDFNYETGPAAINLEFWRQTVSTAWPSNPNFWFAFMMSRFKKVQSYAHRQAVLSLSVVWVWRQSIEYHCQKRFAPLPQIVKFANLLELGMAGQHPYVAETCSRSLYSITRMGDWIFLLPKSYSHKPDQNYILNAVVLDNFLQLFLASVEMSGSDIRRLQKVTAQKWYHHIRDLGQAIQRILKKTAGYLLIVYYGGWSDHAYFAVSISKYFEELLKHWALLCEQPYIDHTPGRDECSVVLVLPLESVHSSSRDVLPPLATTNIPIRAEGNFVVHKFDARAAAEFFSALELRRFVYADKAGFWFPTKKENMIHVMESLQESMLFSVRADTDMGEEMQLFAEAELNSLFKEYHLQGRWLWSELFLSDSNFFDAKAWEGDSASYRNTLPA